MVFGGYSTKAIVLKLLISIIMVISRQLKRERKRIQFYTQHMMFSSKYLTIKAKFEPWWSLERMAIVGDR